MDCRRFRQHHLAYVDDTLPGDLLVAAEAHVFACPACRAQDTLVRRSLLLARNLPPVECSADFDARLAARLAELRCGRPLPSLRVDDDALTGDADFLLPAERRGAATARAAGARVGRSLGAARTTLRSGTPRVAALAASLLMAAGVGVVWRDAQGPTVFAVPGAVAGAPLDGGDAAGVAAGDAPQAAQAAMSAASVTASAVTPVVAPVVAPARRVFRAVRPSEPTRMAEASLLDSLDDGSLASTGMMMPAAVGVSVWPAAFLAGEMPVEMLRARVRRGGGAQSGVTLVDLRR